MSVRMSWEPRPPAVMLSGGHGLPRIDRVRRMARSKTCRRLRNVAGEGETAIWVGYHAAVQW